MSILTHKLKAPSLFFTIFSILVLFAAVGCNSRSASVTSKFANSDPFKNSMVASQQYNINCDSNNVIEGNKGTVIFCPKGCFLDAKGNIFEGTAEIELAEAFALEDILLSNLETTSNGLQLESGGMLYFNVTANGEQLTINKNLPVQIEIPTDNKQDGMMAYKGVRDDEGNMNWIDPVPINNYLTTTNLSELDFLPYNFYATVQKNLPYKNYKIATPELVDSFYYSLSYQYDGKLLNSLLPTNYNEPFLNDQARVTTGVYSGESYLVDSVDFADTIAFIIQHSGVNPAIIKVIKTAPFQNTFIATKAFETRLQEIFKVCSDEALEMYINNLDKNLYEVDSMVADFLKNEVTGVDSVFESFYKQKLTNVEDADKNTASLKDYYSAQLKKVEADLKRTADKMLALNEKETEKFSKVVEEYKDVLFRREKYRMEKYSFSWTNTGWVNVDKPAPVSEPYEISAQVTNGSEYDRVYTYLVMPTIKSITRLNTKDKVNFLIGNSPQARLFIPNASLEIISIGYKGEAMFTASAHVPLNKKMEVTLTLQPSTKQQFNNLLEPFDNYRSENSIKKDLKYMDKMFMEEQRQKLIRSDLEIRRNLMYVAFPCGYEYMRDVAN